MIKFIVCEDQDKDLTIFNNIIVKMMMQYNCEYRIYKFKGYDDKLNNIINDKNSTKIYIIDIGLQGKSGLEIASEIRDVDTESKIVFVTCHPECKNDIFYSRLQVVDYITKGAYFDVRLEETLRYILDMIFQEGTLIFSYNHTQYIILLKEINYIEKIPTLGKCAIHLISGEERYISTTIAKLKERLGGTFFQTHKGCLVNLCNVKTIHYSKYTIYFKNGESTPLLGYAYRKDLKARVGDY